MFKIPIYSHIPRNGIDVARRIDVIVRMYYIMYLDSGLYVGLHYRILRDQKRSLRVAQT